MKKKFKIGKYSFTYLGCGTDKAHKKRLFSNIVKEDRGYHSDCWIWQGATTSIGYGQFSYKSKPTSAHRVAFILTNGEIREGHIIAHRCDVRNCINPEHLFACTVLDNVRDRDQKNRTYGVVVKYGGKVYKSIKELNRQEFPDVKYHKLWYWITTRGKLVKQVEILKTSKLSKLH